MSTHALVWTYDQDTVTVTAVCNDVEDANCRLACNADCETYSHIYRHEDQTFDGQTVKRYTHDDCDAGMRPTECNVCLFLNESGCIEESNADRYPHGERFEIGSVAIEPVWDCDGYLWKRATHAANDAEGAAGE